VEAAAESRRLSRFVVSTDDTKIAAVAQTWGAETHLRPPQLAHDDTPAFPVVVHLLGQLDSEGEQFDSVVYLQPTSPLRTARHIDEAIKLLDQSGADSVVSVYQVEDHHPARMYRLKEDRLEAYDQESAELRRQRLPAVYHRNGAIYACRREVLETQRTLTGSDLCPYIMPRESSINIDDELDLMLADLLLRNRDDPKREAA
jgi:CMP-N-acetylneuraminic acid synthetase